MRPERIELGQLWLLEFTKYSYVAQVVDVGNVTLEMTVIEEIKGDTRPVGHRVRPDIAVVLSGKTQTGATWEYVGHVKDNQCLWCD